MATIAQALDRLMRCDGALAAAVVDANGPRVLGRAGSPAFDIDLAASGHAAILREELAALAPGGTDEVDDVLVTHEAHYQLLRPCAGRDGVFVLFVLERPVANLALARRVLREAEETL
jgi:hypothetical protein